MRFVNLYDLWCMDLCFISVIFFSQLTKRHLIIFGMLNLVSLIFSKILPCKFSDFIHKKLLGYIETRQYKSTDAFIYWHRFLLKIILEQMQVNDPNSCQLKVGRIYLAHFWTTYSLF